jgi:hypothetical protein
MSAILYTWEHQEEKSIYTWEYQGEKFISIFKTVLKIHFFPRL